MKTLTKCSSLICAVLMLLMAFASCSAKGGGAKAPGGMYGSVTDGMADADLSVDGALSEGEIGEEGESAKPEMPEENVALPSGMITAGAWNDNKHYDAWLELFKQGGDTEGEGGKFYDYTLPGKNLGYDSLNRIKVSVNIGENPVCGAKVVASDAEGNVLYSAVSDASGVAYLFTNAESGNITVTSGEGSSAASFTKEERTLNVDLSASAEKLNVIELMLMVDVTGSMGDEIHFLKAELRDVINRIAENNLGAQIKLAMLFYRDTDDDIPFDYYDFTDVTTKVGIDKMQEALDKQYADGGGDYPEAVDEALEIAVNKQWSTGATTKIIFHVLDAPAHEGERHEKKLVNATKTAAEKGIRICPIICSGADRETEYPMRQAAIYTGGTFVFVTDDSGIGGAHHDPDLPNAVVELLNSLMVRLVNGYHTGVFEAPVYWKEDPNLANKEQ